MIYNQEFCKELVTNWRGICKITLAALDAKNVFKKNRRLTVHVELDRRRNGNWDVVVRSLASQDRVEVLALQLVEDQLVLHLEVAEPLERVVQQSVVSPPSHPRKGPPTKCGASEPDGVADFVGTELESDLVVVVGRVDPRFFRRNWKCKWKVSMLFK